MRLRNYLLLCTVVTLVWVAGLLFVPAFSQAVEAVMLGFLSSNA